MGSLNHCIGCGFPIATGLSHCAECICEDDSDQACTPMPEHCVIWPCSREKRPLELRGKYMICPTCGSSYGEPDPQPIPTNPDAEASSDE